MITRTFFVARWRSERVDHTVKVIDPHLLDGWCNPVETMRWVFGLYLYGIAKRWTENTLIPDTMGDNGVWTATDWPGRHYKIYDVEFKDGNEEKERADDDTQALLGAMQAPNVWVDYDPVLQRIITRNHPRPVPGGPDDA